MSREEYIELIVAKLERVKILRVEQVYVFAKGLCADSLEEVQDYE
jgi:hypothetical protein